MTTSAAEQRAMRRALELAAHRRRPARAQPAGRLRAARRRGPHGRRGLPPRGRHRPRRGRRAGPGRGARPRHHRRRHPRALQPHRPHRPLRAGAGRGRRTPGGASRSATPTRSPPAARRRCAPRASTSRPGCWPTRPARSTGSGPSPSSTGAPSSPGSSPPPSTAAAPPPTAPAGGSPAPAARRDTHRLRALCDTMLVGTNTVEVDDPQLTVRDEHDRPLARQPLRAVMGERDLDPGRRVFDDARRDRATCAPATRTPRSPSCFARDRQHVFLEGGPTLAAAFLRAGLVDEIVVYVAPLLLGAGTPRRGRPRNHHDRRRVAPPGHRRHRAARPARRARRGAERPPHPDPVPRPHPTET